MCSRIKALLAGLILSALPLLGLHAQTPIQLGETHIPGIADNGNANLLAAQGPYALTTAATIQAISFYVTTAGGQLRLGLFTSGPNNDCRSGTLKAQTNAFTPGSNKWNTANVVTQVSLPTGNYCVAYLPSSNSLGFRKGITQGSGQVSYSFTFGPMPSTYSANPPQSSNYHWGLYATLLPAPPHTLQLSFDPPSDAVVSTAPLGTVITKPVASWSDGVPFTGTYTFGSPNFADGGCVAFDASFNVVVNCDLSGDVNTQQNFTVTATQ